MVPNCCFQYFRWFDTYRSKDEFSDLSIVSFDTVFSFTHRAYPLDGMQSPNLMKLDDIFLMAYVDGTLTDRERSDVESALAVSTEMTDRVACLQASNLPYAAAFKLQKLAPPPPLLTMVAEEISNLAQTKASSSAVDLSSYALRPSANDYYYKGAPASAVPTIVLLTKCIAPVWLGVARWASAHVHGLWSRFVSASTITFMGQPAAGARTLMSSRIVAALNHQQLYSCNTLANVAADVSSFERAVKETREDDKLPVHIADLRSAGLTFKRLQRLRFNNKPLAQILYTAENGAPVALYVMSDPKPDWHDE